VGSDPRRRPSPVLGSRATPAKPDPTAARRAAQPVLPPACTRLQPLFPARRHARCCVSGLLDPRAPPTSTTGRTFAGVEPSDETLRRASPRLRPLKQKQKNINHRAKDAFRNPRPPTRCTRRRPPGRTISPRPSSPRSGAPPLSPRFCLADLGLAHPTLPPTCGSLLYHLRLAPRVFPPAHDAVPELRPGTVTGRVVSWCPSPRDRTMLTAPKGGSRPRPTRRGDVDGEPGQQRVVPSSAPVCIAFSSSAHEFVTEPPNHGGADAQQPRPRCVSASARNRPASGGNPPRAAFVHHSQRGPGDRRRGPLRRGPPRCF